MSRTLTGAMATALAAETLRPVLLARLDFPSGVVAVNTGVTSLSFGGDTYLGVGSFGNVSAMEEELTTSPRGLQLTLSGVSASLVATALGEEFQGRDCKVYFGLFDADLLLIADPTLMFRGRMDSMDIMLGKDGTITLGVENRLADLFRPRVARNNSATHQRRFPNDRFFDFVPEMVEKELLWGREAKSGK